MGVLASVVFVPSAPLLVPALAGPRALDTEPVRAATLVAGADLADAATRWFAIGATDDPGPGEIGESGTFARFGVDVPVSLASSESSASRSAGYLPLSMLVAGWLRAEVGADNLTPVLVAQEADPAECARVGADLSRKVDEDTDRLGVLVVGDGAISLSPRAPGGGLRESAVELQRGIDDAIATGDTLALAGLRPDVCAVEGVGGRAAWQVAAAMCAGRPMTTELRYADAPFGVGYVVAVWTPR